MFHKELIRELRKTKGGFTLDIQILTQPRLSDGENYSLGEELKHILVSKKPKFTPKRKLLANSKASL